MTPSASARQVFTVVYVGKRRVLGVFAGPASPDLRLSWLAFVLPEVVNYQDVAVPPVDVAG
jgi:hypothetical protein